MTTSKEPETRLILKLSGILILVIALGTPQAAAQSIGDWSQPGGNPIHASVNNSLACLASPQSETESPPELNHGPTSAPPPPIGSNPITSTNLAIAQGTSEWTQDAHDAQRTGYTPQEPTQPWTLKWTWNGPDSGGGTGRHFYHQPEPYTPWEARTVTGGANIYVPANDQGIYALAKSDGHVVWNVRDTSFNCTPAYDVSSGHLFAGGDDGRLYKINASTGQVVDTYNAGSPIKKSIMLVGSAVYAVAANGQLHKVDSSTMSQVWVYSANAQAGTPPAYSAGYDTIIYATEDLYVHAVNNSDGSQKWRVKPTPNWPGFPNQFTGYWPVVAEQHGVVFLRMRLDQNALYGPGSSGKFPNSNAETRSYLQNNPHNKNLFALNLADGSEKFIPAVGYGGVEDLIGGQPYLNIGPVPVIKTLPDGKEVAYIHFRNGQNAPDFRWDSHMGEMVLDSSTVPGLQAGDLRFVKFGQEGKSYTFITDEQSPLTMAGDTLFHAHWGASESIKITDRSNTRGLSADNPITSEYQPTVIRRMQACTDFDPFSHWTECGLTLFDDTRYWIGPGFWVYWDVLDPPTPHRGAYSEGILPRYTYVSDGLIIVEGNGGDLMVFEFDFQPHPDLSSSNITAWPPAAKSGQTVNFAITVRNTGSPLSQTVHVTDTIPAGLSYVPGSLGATAGTWDDSHLPNLYWSGDFSTISEATISFSALVTVPPDTPQSIPNTAIIDAGDEGVLVRTVMIVANGISTYLPCILRGTAQ